MISPILHFGDGAAVNLLIFCVIIVFVAAGAGAAACPLLFMSHILLLPVTNAFVVMLVRFLMLSENDPLKDPLGRRTASPLVQVVLYLVPERGYDSRFFQVKGSGCRAYGLRSDILTCRLQSVTAQHEPCYRCTLALLHWL